MRKMLPTIVLLVVLVAVGYGAYFFARETPVQLPPSPQKEELAGIYQTALELEEKIKEDSENWQYYLSLALQWKLLGDVTNNEIYHKRADWVYETAALVFGKTNYVLYVNWGDIAKALGEFDRAKEYYTIAIEISPARKQPYLHLAELFEYNLDKDSEEVAQVYAQGLIATGRDIALLVPFAAFLERVGRTEEALNMWKLVLERSPDDELIRQKVEELGG